MDSYERQSGGLVGSIFHPTSTKQPFSNVDQDPSTLPTEYSAAATQIQSAFRGFIGRKEIILGLHRENVVLKEMMKEKDSTIMRMKEQLALRKAMIERLASELDLAKASNYPQHSNSVLNGKPNQASGRFVRSMSTDTNAGFQSDSTLFGYSFGESEHLPKESKERMLDNIYAAFSQDTNPGQDTMVPAAQKQSETTMSSSPSSLVGQLGSSHTSSNNIWGPVGTNLQQIEENVSMMTFSDPFKVGISEQMKNIWSTPTFTSTQTANIQANSHMYGKKQVHSGTMSATDLSFMNHPSVLGIKPNFKSLIDKIIRSNDQPSSIYLQQRLKTETNPEFLGAIFDAILHQSISLMKNRFGNFLVQCCFESCSQQQIQLLVQKMQGHIMILSCDRFGCHVMQKALDCLTDELRVTIISELLRYVHETLTHRFACHVWQRIFEIKWSTNEPGPIIGCIFNTLKGHWRSIANDENGSLVVQCIFENSPDQEKRAIVLELFESTLDIAQGQWGNWVMQHLLEHGTPAERTHITNVVTENVLLMSLDQYASKVVERCLKVCSKKEVYLIVNQLINHNNETGQPLLLQMMNHQYGNYVVQNILCIAEAQQRDTCLRILVPNLNLLRGSKYGQRVASLCEKYLRVPHGKFNQFSLHTNPLHPHRQDFPPGINLAHFS